MRLAPFALSAAILLTSTAFGQQLARQPYLQSLDTDSVVVMWMTDVETESWVEVWKEGDEQRVRWHSNVPTQLHQMPVPRLEADTKYNYRVGHAEDKYLSETYTFQTAVPDGADKYSFVVYGDHRNNPEAHKSVVDAIMTKTKEWGMPRFVLDTGDLTGLGEHKTDFYNEQFFGPAAELLSRVCYFVVIGNHEADRAHPRIPFRYLNYLEPPTHNSGTEYYYSFDFGNAHFTMLDVYSTDFATGSKQWEWLEDDLKNSDKKWKFVTMHYPIFVQRTAPSVTYGNMEIREHLVPLFEKYGVAAVFSGDSHFYQRSEVNGIAYVCAGGGGAPLYTPGNDMDYVRASKSVYHYVWAKMEGDTLTGYAFDPQNELIDKFTIGYRLPVTPTPIPTNFTRQLPAADAKGAKTIIVESRDSAGELTKAPQYQEIAGMASSSVKSAVEGLSGNGSRFSDNNAKDGEVLITPPIEAAGKWLISVTVPNAGSVDAPNSLFEVESPGKELIRGRIDLSATNAGDKWYDLGLFELAPGATLRLMEMEDEPGRFYVDAVKFTHYE